MNAKIEWDSAAASAETAPADVKLLNAVVPLYNKLVDIVAKYTAANDLDSAVEEAAANSTDKEVVEWREQIAKAQKLIEANSAKIDEKVRAELLKGIDPEFDKQKVVAEYNDTKSELKKNGTGIRDMFKLLNFVTSETSPAGRESNFKGVTPNGELLLKVLDVPKLEGEKTSTGGASEAVKEFNRNAKEWARTSKEWTEPVADKGALSTALKEAYSKATNTPIPS
jgi:hypothetical protein